MFRVVHGSEILNEDGKSNGSYIPRYQNLDSRHPDFVRGYSIMVKGGAKIFPDHHDMIDGFGAEYKRRLKELHPAVVTVYARGEALPTFDSYVELDKNVVDAWGIPVLRINYKRTDNDYKMLPHAVESLRELMHAAGAEVIHENNALAMPGNVDHHTGTVRMGNDPKSSVLNKFNQAHDMKNLFVIDGACWPSSGCQNPTLTFLAIAWRASDYLAEQFRLSEV